MDFNVLSNAHEGHLRTRKQRQRYKRGHRQMETDRDINVAIDRWKQTEI